jgi:hypothetical protein
MPTDALGTPWTSMDIAGSPSIDRPKTSRSSQDRSLEFLVTPRFTPRHIRVANGQEFSSLAADDPSLKNARPMNLNGRLARFDTSTRSLK